MPLERLSRLSLIPTLLVLTGAAAAAGGEWVVAGIFQLLLFVGAMVFALVALINSVTRANTRDRMRDPRLLAAVDAEVAQVVLDYSQGHTPGDRHCPACSSVIRVDQVSGAPEQILTSCTCGLSAGQYALKRT